MKVSDILAAGTTPLTAPAFPAGSHRFLEREYLNIVYRTDADAFRAAVPEPLTVDEPLVRFEVMHMGDVDGFGPYTECGQALAVSFDGERGEYLHGMWLDNAPAIFAGREQSAYPKSFGTPRLRVDDGALVGTLRLGELPVATATMAYKNAPLDPALAAEQIGVPTWMVKLVPGPGRPSLARLVRTQISDLTVKQAWSGPARLQLFDHVLAPLADLPVREIVSASHVLTDLTLAPAETVHDYLEDRS
ncbi:acetoacetate decarboxylase [Pseudonocardia sediminis]|uniref:Acetoacetate decarboxylase n=1 Tax=Pseudonocardia sediminis TaxID=1397368 RepID=A0A4Q7V020_PSEST|nr:acetoacetate decarboxylase [Pseudonocardia sediminis]RZT86631.1 acetoacetate decarboxylase [Pseudonocardia sediminis]